MPKKALLVIFILSGLLAFSSSSFADLINGDFSAGFLGWKGQVRNLLEETSAVDSPPGSFTDNFALSSGAAVLATSVDLNDLSSIYSVFLFQEFPVNLAPPGEQLFLTYELSISLTDLVFDSVFAQLNFDKSGDVFLQTIDLLPFRSVEITSLSGQDVELLFGIEDLDNEADSLTIDNILITSAVIPEPNTLTILLLGLVLLGLASRGWRKRR